MRSYGLANDANAVWMADSRIMYSSTQYGFREEAALHDETFQQYGTIMIMDADGSNRHVLNESLWEDSIPLFVPDPPPPITTTIISMCLL